MYIHICVYIYVYIYVYVCICIYMYTYTNISMDPRETLSTQTAHTHRTCQARTRLLALWPPDHYHEPLTES